MHVFNNLILTLILGLIVVVLLFQQTYRKTFFLIFRIGS